MMTRMFGFFPCAKELAVETASAPAISTTIVSFVFIRVSFGWIKQEVKEIRAAFVATVADYASLRILSVISVCFC